MKIARFKVTNALLYSDHSFFSEAVFKLGFTIVRMETLIEFNSNYAYVIAPFFDDVEQGSLIPEILVKIALADDGEKVFSYEML
jgi:hypothetical protein